MGQAGAGPEDRLREVGVLILERASGHFCFPSWKLDWRTFGEGG